MLDISPLTLSGPGSIARPVSLPDIPQIAERRVDHIEKQLDAGKLDTQTLDKRLQARFGDAAKGIVGDDGSVDFDRLEKLIIEARSEKLQERISAHFGEKGDGIVGSDGSIDKERLRELFAGERTDQIFDRLEKNFGADARKVISEDGKIDFDALKRLIASKNDHLSRRPPVSERPGGDTPPPVVDITRPEIIRPEVVTRPETILRPEAIAQPETARPDDGSVSETERPSVRPSDQLAQLRTTLFEARLERHFGDDTARIFDKDGKIDIEVLKKLFEESEPGRKQGPQGEKYSAIKAVITQQSPFFDIRA